MLIFPYLKRLRHPTKKIAGINTLQHTNVSQIWFLAKEQLFLSENSDLRLRKLV